VTLLRDANGQGPVLGELRRRLRWAVLGFILAFSLLIGRLWQLQVLRGDTYYQRTVQNVVHQRYLPSVRGKILDRSGLPLADNRPAFNIYATPREFTDEVRGELARILGLSDEDLLKIGERIAVGKRRDSRQPVLILEDQVRERAALVAQSKTRLAGVEVHHEPYRFYPQGDLAAHLIGYMSQMTATEYDRLSSSGYDSSELIGRYGLESAWENYLRGKKGIERFAVDARGRRLDEATTATLITGPRIDDPVPGANLVLTIDAGLQRAAEKAVAHLPAAAVIVVEIHTGRLLAVVSKPSFDPNVMTGHLTRAEETLLLSDPRKPFIDKALRAEYPPGSVFKFVTALAALEDGQAAEDEPIVCNGSYELANTTFRCTAAHGKLDLLGAIQHSCNIYFWKLAERTGLDRIAEVARAYGFGAPSQLGLNGDAPGLIPTKAWYEARTRYKVGYATNAATGQGDVSVSVIQVAMAYAALANDGTLLVPQVVDHVESSSGERIVSFEPKVMRKIKTPYDALDIWRRGMRLVMSEPGGTAYELGRSDLVQIVGKTGTAEVRKRRKKDEGERVLEAWHPTQSHAWFAGWAPADNPEIAITVLVEHGGSGGKIAAPVAKAVLEAYYGKIKPKAMEAAAASAASAASAAEVAPPSAAAPLNAIAPEAGNAARLPPPAVPPSAAAKEPAP
jgi:penicillin-binding protein 2